MQEAFLREEKGGEVQTKEMLYCPMMGTREPVPDTATAWREEHGHAWVFNPWTGRRRTPIEIEQDPQGRVLIPPGETPTGECERHLFMEFRASGALGQFRRAGWCGRLDAQRLIVKLHKDEQVLSFKLTDPVDEERYYQLLHLEVWRLATQ